EFASAPPRDPICHQRYSRAGSAYRPDLHSFPTRRSSDLIPTPTAAIASTSTAPAAVSLAAAASGCTCGQHRSMHRSTAVLISSRSEEHTSELQSRFDLVCRLLLEKQKHTQAATNGLLQVR